MMEDKLYEKLKKAQINYASFKQIFDIATANKCLFSDVIIAEQSKACETTVEDLLDKMKMHYDVMQKSIVTGLTKECKLKIEQENGAKILNDYVKNGKSILGEKLGLIAARAMAVSEVNASMGKICASPTAGSCGIMPASILSIEEFYNIPNEKTIKSIFTGAGIGLVISNVMGVAGATAGCQAECGAATAMAAGTIVEMLGGSNEQILTAVSIALKNVEGLVCDPVASLVECPCIKRNAHGAVSAVLAADMALAGIISIIDTDDVLISLKQVGRMMSTDLKETSLAGLAATDKGKELYKKVFG